MKKKITALIFLFVMLVAFETHAATYKIKGTFNGWADVTLTQNAATEYYNPTPLYCKASQSWSEICIYNSDTNSYYQSNGNTLEAGSDYYFGSNGNNISTSLNAGKSYVFYLETNMKKVYVQAKYDLVYLRGSIGSTNWGLSDDYVFATTDGNEYTFAVSSMSNTTEFKVYNRGTNSWFGYNELTLSGANFSNNGGNIKLNEDLTDVIITYNASAKTLKVSKAIDAYTLKIGSTEVAMTSSDDGATYTGTTTLSASQAITLVKNGTETLYASETATYTGGDAIYTMTGTSGGVTTGSGNFSGNYTFTYTTESKTLAISGAAMTIPTYTVVVFGNVNGGDWNGNGITLTQVEGTTKYTGTVKMQSNSKHFRVKIDGTQYGPKSTDENEAVVLDTETQMYVNTSKALYVPTEGASYIFTVDAAAKTLIVSEVAQEDTYNVKYTTNSWSSWETPAMKKQDDGTYTYTFTDPANGMQLCLQKNGSDFWSGDADREYTGGTKTFTMGTGVSGQNITFNGSFSGDYTLSYNPTDNKLTISAPASEKITVKVIGQVNNKTWDDQVGVSLAQVGTTSTYQGRVKLTGTSFRIVLGEAQFGPQTDTADEPVTIGTTEQMYNNYKKALTVSDALKYIFTVDATAKTVKLDYISFVIRTSAADNFNTDAYTFSTTDGKTYTCSGVTLDAGTQFLIKEAGDEVWLGKSNLTVTGADITTGDTGTNNIKLVSAIKNATVTFDATNYSLTIVSEEEVKQFHDPGENYIWGDATLTFEYRNDDNTSAAWTSIPLTFDKYDSTTNPYGLEAYASDPFEVAVKSLDWRIRTSTGYIVRKGASTEKNVWLENFCKELTAVNNTFTELTPGVKYRIVIDTTHGDGVSKANPKIGIFAAESSYPWGEIDELYVHGNFSGSWPDNNNTDEANHLKYYPDSKIWSVSFATGEKQSFSSELGATGTGFEFCLRNKYNYIWFKDIFNFPINEWVSNELKIQTVDNNGNYYSNKFEANTTYMLQVRINPEDASDYQIRIVKALSAESLYIVGKDTSNGWDASQPDTFTQYKDENGVAIEGRYYYTINYTTGTGEGFKIATAKGESINDWDPVNASLLSPADNTVNDGNNAFSATIDTPYTYTCYGDKSKGTGNWVISDGPGYYSIIVDEIAQTVTIVKPSIRVAISDILLNTYTGELSDDNAKALTTTDKMPNGATAETPIYYNNVNYLNGIINVLAQQVPTGLDLVISDVKVTVNGTDEYTIAGNFVKGKNIINLLPYGGAHATYQVTISYYISNDGAIGAAQTATSEEVSINLVPDFEAPLTFDASEMKRQFNHNGVTNVVSAYVEAPVDFISAYNVYPGYAVTVARDLTDDSTILGNEGTPIGCNWDMTTLSTVSYLPTYDGTANSNWSAAAYTSNKLPVAVPTTMTLADLSDAAKMPQIKYELFGHYPIIDLAGTMDPCGGYLSGTVAAKIARTAETPVTTLSPSTDVANYRLSVYTTTADRSVTTKFSTTDITTGIENIDADAADGEEIYFNLQGVRITNPQSGIYIRYNGRTFDKVYIR